MTRHPNRLWIVVLLLGWAFDYLFWKKPVGMNYAIFLTGCLLVGLLLLVSYGRRPALKSLWLIPPFLFFAVISFVREEPLTQYLAKGLALVCAGLLIVTYLGGRWMYYSLLDYFHKLLELTAGAISHPILFFLDSQMERAERSEPRKAWPVKPVVRGLLIALPIIVLFTYLLSSADLVFNQKLYDFYKDHFTYQKLGEYGQRLVIILICAYSLSGVFLHAAAKSRDEKLLGEDTPILKRFLGFTESTIVLGSVIVLFLAFVSIQFRYFFGGEVNIGVEGFTYSQYARRGFNELVMVAFLSLLLTLGLSTITQRVNAVQRRAFSGLNVAVLALVLVMLVSAYQRLSLAINWHGFSRLRLYPWIFLVWVGILFAATVGLEIVHHERFFAFAAILASLGFAVTLSLVNVDAEIASYNIARANLGWNFNVNFLSALSPDALPAILEAYDDPKLNAKTHDGIGAALLCYLHSDQISLDTSIDWRTFQYSRWQASKVLNEVQKRASLKKYQVNDEGWLIRVGTPDNAWYECANGYTVEEPIKD